MVVLFYSNWKNYIKRHNAKKYYLPKGIINNYNVIINGKNLYDQPIDSDIKCYKEIRKLTTGQGVDYTTGYLLDYEYTKDHYKLVDLSRQKELDADPKTNQQVALVGQLKNTDNSIITGESMLTLTILEKIKK